MTETMVARVGGYTRAAIAKSIDHSLLQPHLTTDEVRTGCELARALDVASACVRPCDVPLAAGMLAGSDVAVCTVIGFPHGAHTTRVKAFEAEDALANGAAELDMVLNIGRLRSGDDTAVRADIAAVVAVARDRALVKVILENAYLNDEQKVLACRLAAEAGAGFVKTSTGYAPSGATLEDLRLMRASVPPHVRVKAAGGVRTLDALLAALDAGADRIGATATQAILAEFDARAGGADSGQQTANRSDGPTDGY